MSQDKYKEISIIRYLPKMPEFIHAPYIPEMDFYIAIRSGDIKKTRELCNEQLHEKEGLGILSENRLQNMKYHFVISAALIARQCIEGGLSLAESYSMSDYYINRADKLSDIIRISELHDEMALAYAERMRRLLKENIFSRPVTDCIEYILEHLDTRIRMEDLCDHTGLSRSYISRSFRKETGLTVTEYILDKKLETACNMLDYSQMSVTLISSTLAFPSPSYFVRIFRKRYKMSPGKYRASHRKPDIRILHKQGRSS